MDDVSLVEASWSRVETWLVTNAPASHATLNPPAEPRDIAAAEAVIGFPLPAELVTLLRRHNGTQPLIRDGAILPGHEMLLSAAGIPEDHEMRTGIQRNAGDDEDGNEWWNAGWVPFTDNGSGDSLIIDLTVDSEWHGGVGEFDHEGDTQIGRWSSLSVFLHETAESLENGTRFDIRQPSVDSDGCLRWGIGEH